MATPPRWSSWTRTAASRPSPGTSSRPAPPSWPTCFAERGLGVGDRLAVCLRNSPEHLLACFAGWKVGATVVPVRWDLPEWELSRLLDGAAARPGGRRRPRRPGRGEPVDPRSPMPEVIAPRSGGGVQLGLHRHPQGHRAEGPGRLPALHQRDLVGRGVLRAHVEAPAGAVPGAALPHQRVHGLPHPAGWRPHRAAGAVQGPAGAGPHREAPASPGSSPPRPCSSAWPRSRASRTRDLSSLQLGPTGCRAASRLARSPLDRPGGAGALLHVLRRLGEIRHRRSAGATSGWPTRAPWAGGWARPRSASSDRTASSCPPGEIGGIYLRTPTGPLATYVGNDVKPMDTTADGFTSVGDMGWLDEDGFLFMADRRVDMIVTGGVERLPGRGRGGPERAPRHRRRGHRRAARRGRGAGGSTPSWPPIDPLARRRRCHRLRQGPAGSLQGAQDGGVRRRPSRAARP